MLASAVHSVIHGQISHRFLLSSKLVKGEINSVAGPNCIKANAGLAVHFRVCNSITVLVLPGERQANSIVRKPEK